MDSNAIEWNRTESNRIEWNLLESNGDLLRTTEPGNEERVPGTGDVLDRAGEGCGQGARGRGGTIAVAAPVRTATSSICSIRRTLGTCMS